MYFNKHICLSKKKSYHIDKNIIFLYDSHHLSSAVPLMNANRSLFMMLRSVSQLADDKHDRVILNIFYKEKLEHSVIGLFILLYISQNN